MSVTMERPGSEEAKRGRPTRWLAGATGLTVVLLATGCLSLTNHSQSCTSSGGLMGPSEFSCSGTAETVKGGEEAEVGGLAYEATFTEAE